MITIMQKYRELYERKEKISVVTCYDYSFAKIISKTEMDTILVGDSLGMVFQGMDSTVSVTLDEMIYHCKAVKRGSGKTHVVCDLPFLSYQVSIKQGLKNAGRVIKETNCDAVKLEGANNKILSLIRELSEIGVPVMGHLGLTPQSFQTLGGFKVQGRGKDSAKKILEEAQLLQEAGVFSIVLEMIPENLGKEITENLKIPTIGIGAGRFTTGQVLVLYDLLGMNPDFNPKFLKKYSNSHDSIFQNLELYSQEVKKGIFPNPENSFSD